MIVNKTEKALVTQLCDLALRQGGLNVLRAVEQVLASMKEEEEKQASNSKLVVTSETSKADLEGKA